MRRVKGAITASGKSPMFPGSHPPVKRLLHIIPVVMLLFCNNCLLLQEMLQTIVSYFIVNAVIFGFRYLCISGNMEVSPLETIR